MYNRRKYLQSLKDVEIKVASQHEVDYYFSLLNGFHHERWGKPCFREAALKFHKILIGHLDECQGYELCCIFIDSKPISLLYNLTAGDVSYNIQAGYVENYDKKLSLGTMHLGYAIEQAFEDKAINAFDLLIGSGKNEFYKNKYKGDVLEFETIHIVHSKVLILFYYFLTIIPEPVRKYLSGFKQKYFE